MSTTTLKDSLGIPIPSFLENNPYFEAGFGMGLLGLGFTLFKRSSQLLLYIGQRQLLTTLEITSNDASFPWILKWIQLNTNNKLRRVCVETIKRQTPSGKSISTLSLQPSQGKHYIRYNNYFIMIERDRELRTRVDNTNTNNNNNTVWESIKFTTFGRNPNIYKEILNDAQLLSYNKDFEYTTIYTSWGYNGWKPFGNSRKKRNINSVILDDGIKDNIINDLYEFMKSREWYYNRGIPYRRGYLLYGEPGSGKSSFVTAIAGHIGYDICIISLAQPGLTDDHLAISLINIPEKCILLFEDIDCLFNNNYGNNNNINDMRTQTNNMNHLTFSGFLNALDGVSAGEERIIFMTTNYIQYLDNALIRPGRIDVTQYLGNATKYQIEHMLLRFYPELKNDNEKIIQFINDVFGNDVSMAELQEYFLLHKNNYDTALLDAKMWVNTLINSPQRSNKRKSIHKLNEKIL